MNPVKLFSRLRHEWTKNDGKPWEEWGPGRDLKETVMVVALVILLIAQIGVGVWWLVDSAAS